MRSGPWKFVFPLPGGDESEWLVSRSGDLLAEILDPVTELELYYLKADIGEQRNVAALHPDIVERLTA